MGSYGYLFVDGAEVFSFKNEFDPILLLLFTTDDVRPSTLSADRRQYDDEETTDIQLEFAIRGDRLLDRLDTLGMGHRHMATAFDDLRRARIRSTRAYLDEYPAAAAGGLRALWQDRLADLEALSLDGWKERVESCLQRREPRFGDGATGELEFLLDLWDDADPRLLLRAVAEVSPASEVAVDLSDLVGGGWYSQNLNPRSEALDHFGWAVTHGAPVVVLTEGRTDATVLGLALQSLYPHLDSYLRFADFTSGAEGGAAALVRTVRAFAAAGIANRVIALFDNDSAAHDAMRTIDRHPLPRNITVLQYPPIDVARSYPTLGPNGRAAMDVNGLAGSIELYMGTDVLSDPDGSLRPVQWKGYIPAVRAYQGEILDKNELLDRFRAKCERATDETCRTDEDWSGMHAIFRLLLDTLGAFVPVMEPTALLDGAVGGHGSTSVPSG